jgi:hypothetical protein
MKTLSLAVLLALAGTVAAQEQTKTEPKKPPPLNLRLDEATSSAPRVTFGSAPASQTKEEREKGLPELGGKPSQAFDRKISSPVNSSSGNSVIPSAMDPNINRE